MNDKNTSNPADKNTPALPPDVAKQLSTIDGAEALARQYKTMVLGTGSDGSNARIDLCVQAAQQQARYLGFLAKVAAAKKARASAALTAGNRVKACSDELSSARAALDELTGGLDNVTAKITDLKYAVTQKDQELTDAAAHARQEFELAMDADDEIAQRAAAEQLSQAEVNMGMFRQHGPDNLRLRVLEARRDEALAAIKPARQELDDAQEALNQALFKRKLIDLDEAFDQAIQAWLDAINAQRDCVATPFLAQFDAITLWASSEMNITSGKAAPVDAPVSIGPNLLYPLLAGSRQPDLSVFADAPIKG